MTCAFSDALFPSMLQHAGNFDLCACEKLIHPLSSHTEAEQEEVDEEDELLSEIEVEQAPPVVPIPAPVEPPVKRKRGRPPKNKPESK